MRSPHTSYRWRGERVIYIYIYIYAFSRRFYPKRFYPKRLTIAVRLYIFISMCVPWELNPQPFALLMQCSTTEPQRNTIEKIKCMRSPHTSYRWRGESHRANQEYALTTHQLQVERRESHRANQVYALTTHQLQVESRERHRANQVYALTTHQLQVERRERHRANQVYALTTHQLQVERRES